MGLIGGMARTAVVAGTATHVSNNVSRRQMERQQRKYGAPAEPAYAAPAAPPVYAPPPPAPVYAAPVYAAPPPAPVYQEPAPAATDTGALTEQLTKLGELRAQGILTDEEF